MRSLWRASDSVPVGCAFGFVVLWAAGVIGTFIVLAALVKFAWRYLFG